MYLLLWPDKLSLHVSSTKTLAYSETATIWNDFHYHLYDATQARFILSCQHYNDPCATANAAVPAGFAGFPAAKRFINNADLNKMFGITYYKKVILPPLESIRCMPFF
jgi:hypothetical protein